MAVSPTTVPIDEARISNTLSQAATQDAARVREILAHAREGKGLDDAEMAVLMGISDPELLHELFDTARDVKDMIYGRRLVLFAPLYISNLCANDCAYCAFRITNRKIKRRALTMPEITHETELLLAQGHKRVLLVAGESYPKQGFQYVLDSIRTVYDTKTEHGNIRRINVNVAPLNLEEFKLLKESNIGTYQIFQETYHRDTYARMHTRGPKKDYDFRITAMDRAMEAGIDDVGVGVLFGLFDWRWEALALMQHIRHLEGRFGVGPHTISVPRLEPATGADVAVHPPKPVSDIDFRKLVAILRLAVPYTGLIMSTRETAEMRRETFALGVSQISAGSRTNPGGYEDETQGLTGEHAASPNIVDDDATAESQFSLGDHRSLDEVIGDLIQMKYIPSFCTGCYRLGRTGADFMDLAKPGDIKAHCAPNGLSSFLEYLMDFATPATREAGLAVIPEMLEDMDAGPRRTAEALLNKVREGKRDVYC